MSIICYRKLKVDTFHTFDYKGVKRGGEGDTEVWKQFDIINENLTIPSIGKIRQDSEII